MCRFPRVFRFYKAHMFASENNFKSLLQKRGSFCTKSEGTKKQCLLCWYDLYTGNCSVMDTLRCLPPPHLTPSSAQHRPFHWLEDQESTHLELKRAPYCFQGYLREGGLHVTFQQSLWTKRHPQNTLGLLVCHVFFFWSSLRKQNHLFSAAGDHATEHVEKFTTERRDLQERIQQQDDMNTELKNQLQTEHAVAQQLREQVDRSDFVFYFLRKNFPEDFKKRTYHRLLCESW